MDCIGNIEEIADKHLGPRQFGAAYEEYVTRVRRWL
jgi:hypothetical protein